MWTNEGVEGALGWEDMIYDNLKRKRKKTVTPVHIDADHI